MTRKRKALVITFLIWTAIGGLFALSFFVPGIVIARILFTTLGVSLGTFITYQFALDFSV